MLRDLDREATIRSVLNKLPNDWGRLRRLDFDQEEAVRGTAGQLD